MKIIRNKNVYFRKEKNGGVVFNKVKKCFHSISFLEYNILDLLEQEMTINKILINENIKMNKKNIVTRSLDNLYWYGCIQGWVSTALINPIDTFKPVENLKFPLSVLWSLTRKCNFSCKHCYMDAGNEGLDIVDKKTINIQIDEFIKMKIYSIVLTGGEVLLYEGIEEILDRLKTAGIQVGLETNGFLVDNYLDLLTDTCNFIQMSIYSAKPHLHDNFVGVKGSFDKISMTTSLLTKKGLIVVHNYIARKRNLEDMFEYLEKYHNSVSFIKITPMEFLGRAKTDLKEDCFKFNEINRLVNIVNGIQKKYKNVFMHLPYINIYNSLNQNMCGAAIRQCFINYNGDVFPCERMPVVCGNIKNDKLSTIWIESNRLNSIRSRQNIGLCSQCNNFNYCKGGCIAMNYDYDRDILQSDKICKYIHHK